MASAHILSKAILREVTEDANFKPLADTETDAVYQRLRTLQKGHFDTTTDKGVTVVAASHGNKSFSFQIADGLGPADIIETCEILLELIEPYSTVSEIRQRFLRRRRTTKPDFSSLNL